MKIYQIQYRFTVRFDEESQYYGYNGKEVEHIFYMGATNTLEASYLAHTYISGSRSNGTYKDDKDFSILSIIEVQGLDIINWPEYKEKSFFEVDNLPDEDLVNFKCTCGENVVCADGWTILECPFCHKKISRVDLVGGFGKYTLVELNDRKE